MQRFNIYDKYTSVETGEEYYFYNPSSDPSMGMFSKIGAGTLHDIPYSSMQPNKEFGETYKIKHDCVEYNVSREIKERVDAAIQEAIDYDKNH